METHFKEHLAGKDSLSLEEIAHFLNAELKGNPHIRVRGIGPLEAAAPDQLSFLTDSRYKNLLQGCKAAALIVSPEFRELDLNLIICGDPYFAMAKVAQAFLTELPQFVGIHPSALVDEDVLMGEGVSIGPFACIDAGAKIGNKTRIGAGVYIGRNVRVGDYCVIHPNVTVMDGCVAGDRVIIHPGVVIGSDGYGYAHDDHGRHLKIPQTGIVQIDDDVEIGANCAIDRATFGKTWIKRGAKIDNLVMIGHNVIVGEDSLLVAQVGISGSTSLGRGVVLGGQVGIAGHIEIGDRVKIGAKSGILHSIKPGQDIIGIPGVPYREWFSTYANIQRLPRLKEELRRLKERVAKLEEELKGNDGHSSD